MVLILLKSEKRSGSKLMRRRLAAVAHASTQRSTDGSSLATKTFAAERLPRGGFPIPKTSYFFVEKASPTPKQDSTGGQQTRVRQNVLPPMKLNLPAASYMTPSSAGEGPPQRPA